MPVSRCNKSLGERYLTRLTLRPTKHLQMRNKSLINAVRWANFT